MVFPLLSLSPTIQGKRGIFLCGGHPARFQQGFTESKKNNTTEGGEMWANETELGGKETPIGCWGKASP